jgi:hypothetical protein
MSCLTVSDLPLSEQAALELSWAEKLIVLCRDVLLVLDSPVKKAASPGSLPLDAGESDSLPVTAE